MDIEEKNTEETLDDDISADSLYDLTESVRDNLSFVGEYLVKWVESGNVSYSEIAKSIPKNFDILEIDNLLNLITHHGIEITGSNEDLILAIENSNAPEVKKIGKKSTSTNSSNIDSVRMYIDKISSAEILDKESENEIATTIASSKIDIIKICVNIPFLMVWLIKLIEEIQNGKLLIRDVVELEMLCIEEHKKQHSENNKDYVEGSDDDKKKYFGNNLQNKIQQFRDWFATSGDEESLYGDLIDYDYEKSASNIAIENIVKPRLMKTFSSIYDKLLSLIKFYKDRMYDVLTISDDDVVKLKNSIIEDIISLRMNNNTVKKMLSILYEKNDFLTDKISKIFSIIDLYGVDRKKFSEHFYLINYNPDLVNDSINSFVNKYPKYEELLNNIDKIKIYVVDIYSLIKKEILISVNEYKPLFAQIKYHQSIQERSKNRLVQANQRLVVAIAKKCSRRQIDISDCIQEGNIGLMKCVDNYDKSMGCRFSTYASSWIKQSIARAIAEQGRSIRIPVHMIEMMNRVNRVSKWLQSSLNRVPTEEEIAEKAGISVDNVRRATKVAFQSSVSLDSKIGDDDGTLGDIIADTRVMSLEDLIDKDIKMDKLNLLLSSLTHREEKVIRLRFGVGSGSPDRTLEEVGKELGVTRERIRQIEAKALRKLKNPGKSISSSNKNNDPIIITKKKNK